MLKTKSYLSPLKEKHEKVKSTPLTPFNNPLQPIAGKQPRRKY
jgi:hypothetical protein